MYDGDHLERDFEALWASEDTAFDADQLFVFLDEVAGSQGAIWQLTKWRGDHGVRPFFNCKAIDCFQQAGYNVYRIRPLHGRLQRFRVLYAYDKVQDAFHLLAVVIKAAHGSARRHQLEYDYEEDHPITRRVREEYDQRGFPRTGQG